MKAEFIFNEFSKKQILVIGDVMIDSYLIGSVTRISPESPVPIVNLKNSNDRLGGAANVALNLLSLGVQPLLCSVISDDIDADNFDQLLLKSGLSNEGIIRSSSRKTTKKTRIIGNNQQLLRVDEESTMLLIKEDEGRFIEHVTRMLDQKIDAVIFEDYNKGLLTDRVITEIISICNDKDIIVTVDPKKDSFFTYKNVTLFKPNLKELKEGLNIDFDIDNKIAFEKAIQDLESKLNNQISLVTLSEKGVFVKDKNEKHYIAAHVRNVSDVSGAGDTVIAIATLCLTIGLDIILTSKIANLAGGLVCEKNGVVPIDKEQLKLEIDKLILE
ncbi:MAG: D-glycero-beta-D-manno-heptose-7-phosphate kinase [Crocinitomicaceae bacterium]|nr:D-glycero-beta-D-manno-heptose-7-phosphate kinase [Crocinitomicaceae bacterium]|tara:strand:+ start:24868 stop:25854 length:987 start_codon:yes stop_codon:yes gene_type:complete